MPTWDDRKQPLPKGFSLRPCPFCGEQDLDFRVCQTGPNAHLYWIYCHACKWIAKEDYNKRRLIRWWNTRKIIVPVTNVTNLLKRKEKT